MSYTEFLPADLHQMRLTYLFHAQLLEVGVGPHIVVARAEIHIHPGGNEILDGRKDTRISLRNHIPVFIPEIPDVPKQKEIFGPVGRNLPQEFDKTLLAGRRIIDIQSQVHVGSEV